MMKSSFGEAELRTTIDEDFGYLDPACLAAPRTADLIRQTLRGDSPRLPAKPALVSVTAPEQMRAFLIAGVIVVGFLVTILFAVWWFSFQSDGIRISATITTSTFDYSSDSQHFDEPLDFAIPGLGELPEAEIPEFTNALQAVTDAVSPILADLAKNDGASDFLQGPPGGLDDRREPGPVTEDAEIWERWRIEHEASNRSEYFTMLQQFGIYLGAVRQRNNKVFLLSHPASDTPDLEETTREAVRTQAIYFWTRVPRFERWEKELFESHELDTDYTLFVQFVPESVQERLLELESSQLSKDEKSVEQIASVRFSAKLTDSGKFEWFVKSVEYKEQENE